MLEKETLYYLERQYNPAWWYDIRKTLINKLLQRDTILNNKETEILDIGSGYGFNIPVIGNYGEVDVIEPNRYANSMLLRAGVRNIFNFDDFPERYPKKLYHLVTMFDVLEHIRDDRFALTIVKNCLLRERGRILIMVPSYKFLWSVHDKDMGHYRRYTKKEITNLLKLAGFKSIKVYYYISLLFPVAIINIFLMAVFKKNTTLKEPPVLLNKFLKLICSIETLFFPWLHLPWGLSMLIRAEKGP